MCHGQIESPLAKCDPNLRLMNLSSYRPFGSQPSLCAIVLLVRSDGFPMMTVKMSLWLALLSHHLRALCNGMPALHRYRSQRQPAKNFTSSRVRVRIGVLAPRVCSDLPHIIQNVSRAQLTSNHLALGLIGI